MENVSVAKLELLVEVLYSRFDVPEIQDEATLILEAELGRKEFTVIQEEVQLIKSLSMHRQE